MSKRLLIRLQHLVVVFQDLGTDAVFITFNDKAMKARGEVFWGEELFQHARLSAFGIVSVRPNWYPPAEMTHAVEVINALTRQRRVVTMGSGQGGYGALKYAKALGAHTAVAFSPQYSIDPADVGEFDTRFAPFHRPKLGNGAAIKGEDLCANNYLFVDPLFKTDVLHARKIIAAAPSSSRIELISVPFAGHDTGNLVIEGEIFPQLIRLSLEEPPAARQQMRNLIRAARGTSKSYQHGKVDHLIRRMGRGTRFIAGCLPSLPAPKRKLVEFLLLVGERAHEQAALMLTEIDDATLAAVPPSWLRHFFRRTGFSTGEERLPATPREAGPESAQKHLRAIKSCIDGGDRDGAVLALDALVAMGAIAEHPERLLEYARKLKHGSALAALLGDPAIIGGAGEDEQFDARLELAGIFSSRRDDKGMMAALEPLAAQAARDASRRRRIIDTIATFDSETLGRTFAERAFNVSGTDLEYLKLRRICLLNKRNSKLARSQLTEIVKTLGADSVLWEIVAQQFAALFNFHAAMRAQEKAIRYARHGRTYALRLPLAKLYTREGHRIRARLQLIRIYLSRERSPEALRPCRDLAVRSRYKWLARLFAATLVNCFPTDLEAMIVLAAIYCRSRRFSRSTELMFRVLSKIDNGCDAPRSAWPTLVETLLALRRSDEARRVLERALTLFPRSKALLKIRGAIVSADSMISRYASG
jgi:tetratricopeptide (TPR) repeat protein